MSVEIRPAEFTMVRFDAGEVVAIAEQLIADLGLDPDLDVVVEVDERIPTGTIELRSLDPITCFAQSGALEHPQRLRSLHPAGTREVLGRLMLEARDRLDPDFGAPALGEPIELPVRVAWDTHLVGRLVRLGGREQKARRRYHYRSRHGFDDQADAAFDELWDSPRLTFAEIAEISARSRQVVG